MWIKICGLGDVATARNIAVFGPDAVGLNFFDKSPRCVTVEVAAEIVAILPEKIEPVGVFVNHSADQIASICSRCGLTTVQLHGDEPPELLAELQGKNGDLRIIRAFRFEADFTQKLAEYLDSLAKLDVRLSACLIDAEVSGVYGGSGETAPWDKLAESYLWDAWPPMILAGGLKPENIGEAIHAVHPWGVDVASGVESTRGNKDEQLVRTFIGKARSAYDGLQSDRDSQ
jgi:phosphoribosylanthranilate isomerase